RRVQHVGKTLLRFLFNNKDSPEKGSRMLEEASQENHIADLQETFKNREIYHSLNLQRAEAIPDRSNNLIKEKIHRIGESLWHYFQAYHIIISSEGWKLPSKAINKTICDNRRGIV
ncbi:hypothetical protein ACJX0J_026213, partial [Zea mays]